MKYLLMIYNQPDFVTELSEDERNELFAEVDTLLAELTESGELVAGQGLAHPSTAKTVRLLGGQPAVTDGPFLETKEQFGGYTAIDCDTLERALDVAQRWPDVRYGGVIEIREIMGEAEPPV